MLGVGNISKFKEELVVTINNRGNLENVDVHVRGIVERLTWTYMYMYLVVFVLSLILSLPRKGMLATWNIVQNWFSMHSAPDGIVVLIKDLESKFHIHVYRK